MPSISQVPSTSHAVAVAVLRVCASQWVDGEFDTMRKAGLDRWASSDNYCFGQWEVPLKGSPPDAHAHLTLQLTDSDGQQSRPLRMVWQIQVIARNGKWNLTEQVELVTLDDIGSRQDLLDNAVDLLFSIEPGEVLSWMRTALDRLGHIPALCPRC